MRVSDEMISRTLTSYLQRGRDSIFDLQSQISSGLRVQRPSDDPGAYSLIRSYQAQDACAKQFQVNANRMDGRLGMTDTKLRSASEILQRVSELVIAGSDGTKPPADMKAMGEEVNQYLEELVSLGNTKYEGEYIFAGLLTNTEPYAVTRTDGIITAVTYQGNADTRSVEIGYGVYVPSTLPGSDPSSTNGVFQSENTNLFLDLIHVRDRLMEGENLVAAEECSVDAPNIITTQGVYATGGRVRLSSTGTLPAGLSADVDYFTIRVSDTEISLAATLEDALAVPPVAIAFTAGTGQLSVTKQSLAAITHDLDQITTVLARVGAYEERVNFAKKYLAADVLRAAEGIEREGAVDVAKVATEMTSRQTAYEAALAITSKMMNTSLLNYM